MELIEYKKIEEFEKYYWWHKGKYFLLNNLKEKYFPGKTNLNMLEIGCGTGEVLRNLSKWGDVTGIDMSPEAVAYCKKKGIKNLITGDINSLDLSKIEGSFDLILCFDVLEHIQDDVLTLKKIHKLLKKGGYLFITVPAYKFLWSSHDEALHHKRRYHSIEITQKLIDAGFHVLKRSYFVCTLFFPLLFVRFMSNFFRKTAYPKTSYMVLPDSINNYFSNILAIEAKIVETYRLPFGSTLVMVARHEN